MRFQLVLIAVLATSPVFANSSGDCPSSVSGIDAVKCDTYEESDSSYIPGASLSTDISAVPGPVAGAGLGYLAIIGGYYLFRRWRKPGE